MNESSKVVPVPEAYADWHLIPQAPSSYEIHCTCQIENFGWLLEQLPRPFGIFNPERKGRIVEVGAFDGIQYSNTWGLLKAGWFGLLIEPMPENIEKCRTEHIERPWVTIEPVACGAKDDEIIEMWFEREGSRIALPGEPNQKIRTLTLDTILRKNGWQPDFDMLVIDTEHYELPTLQGFDLAHWQPKLAIVETHQPYRPIIHTVFEKLYRVFSEDGLNTLFVRKDWSV